MWCLNAKDTKGIVYKIELFGNDDFNTHRRLDIIFQPCTPIQLTRDNAKLASTKCIVNMKSKTALKKKLHETKHYLG